jgi:hypothetical protein
MRIKLESECLLCGEDLAEDSTVDERDVFAIRPCTAEPSPVHRHPIPEHTITRAADMLLCDDCYAARYMTAKRGDPVWAQRCGLCHTAITTGDVFIRATLCNVVHADHGQQILTGEEAVPVNMTTPDVFVCEDCTVDHLGPSNYAFLLDLEYEPEDEDEDD